MPRIASIQTSLLKNLICLILPDTFPYQTWYNIIWDSYLNRFSCSRNSNTKMFNAQVFIDSIWVMKKKKNHSKYNQLFSVFPAICPSHLPFLAFILSFWGGCFWFEREVEVRSNFKIVHTLYYIELWLPRSWFILRRRQLYAAGE